MDKVMKSLENFLDSLSVPSDTEGRLYREYRLDDKDDPSTDDDTHPKLVARPKTIGGLLRTRHTPPHGNEIVAFDRVYRWIIIAIVIGHIMSPMRHRRTAPANRRSRGHPFGPVGLVNPADRRGAIQTILPCLGHSPYQHRTLDPYRFLHSAGKAALAITPRIAGRA